MSTSATTDLIAKKKTAAFRTALRYTVATALSALFGGIYESFSFGVFSFFMIYAFAFPLVLGALPNLLIGTFAPQIYPSTVSRYIYHAGVATLTVGSIFCGALEIYGTTSPYENVYMVVGAILTVTGVIMFAEEAFKSKKGIVQEQI